MFLSHPILGEDTVHPLGEGFLLDRHPLLLQLSDSPRPVLLALHLDCLKAHSFEDGEDDKSSVKRNMSTHVCKKVQITDEAQTKRILLTNWFYLVITDVII